MSILDSIKGQRKLSFRHWRYRLLHWTFGVKDADPKRPQDTGLPKYLYTHFCPLFHLTNLIAILSPIILFIKIVKVVALAFIAGFNGIPWEKIGKLVPSMPKAPPSDQPAVQLVKRKRSAATENRATVNLCCDWDNTDFVTFWGTHGPMYETMTRDEVEVVFKEWMPKVIEARNRSKVRKDKMRERLIFWTNFSRVFSKGFLNVFYFLLAAAALYIMYYVAGPVWDGLCWFAKGVYWLFTDAGSLSFLLLLGKVLFFMAVLFGGFYVLAKVGFIQRFVTSVGNGLAYLSPPFYLVGRFFDWLKGGWDSVVEFVSMFYEENCPPIILVTPEEAAVEAVAEGKKPDTE